MNLIAVDLGASGGRVHLARLTDRLSLTEVHRFDHRPIHLPDATPAGAWCWDVLELWSQVKRGIGLAGRLGPVDSIGIASWGVDYGLVDKSGRLVRPPVAYRDPRVNPAFERVTNLLSRETIYARTGIQFMPINTMYQWAVDAADPDRPLDRTWRALMIPQLLSYWLTGVAVAEHTLSSTTQMYDSVGRKWVTEFAEALSIPTGILPDVVDAGTTTGTLRPSVADELGLPASTKVIAVGSHDTASAVAGTPLRPGRHDAYLSSGTWSLLGVEIPSPLRTEAARAVDLTNEAGVGNTTRLLKNLNGMWLVQECRRVWAEAGRPSTFEQLATMAEAAPESAVRFDVNHLSLSAPGDMPARISAACAEAGHAPPADPAAVVRCILDSLADGYANVLAMIESVTGKKVDALHVVGGGAKNQLLNRLTQKAIARPVLVGPFEATVIGNALVQAIGLGALADLAAARAVPVDEGPST